jgi:signal transduction histidine kinase
LVVVSVLDRGPGFPQALLDRPFERFARGDESRTRATGGAGLGLAIVRAIARAHGGEATIQNREGGGACVRVTLPRVQGT